MPSVTVLKATQHRVLTLTRCLASALKATLTTQKPQRSSPFVDQSTISKHTISGPRHLRRGHIPASKRFQLIHELPIELLAHVFVLGSQDNAMFPVLVSHVCHKWRQVTMRTPTLWRRIVLGPEVGMWKERIHRAKACTLDIQLLPRRLTRSTTVQHHCMDAATIQWYIQPLLPLLPRWRSFEVVFSHYSPYLWNAALSGCCSNHHDVQALALQELTLIYRANDDTKEFCLFSGCAPNLHAVTLDGVRLTWLPSLFSNLTYLDYSHHGFSVGHQAVHDVLSMLEISSGLVELRILFTPSRKPAPPTRFHPVTRQLSLPLLRYLHLRVEGTDIPFELAHLMTLLTTPALTSLNLIDADRRQHSLPSLKSFFYVYAISPSLRFLCIGHGWYDPRMISPLVYALPNLRQLVVRQLQKPDQVLNLTLRMRKRHQYKPIIGVAYLRPTIPPTTSIHPLPRA